jgi:hypothetical protein
MAVMSAWPPREQVRIVRPDCGAGRRVRFQEEWAPLDDPGTDEWDEAPPPGGPKRLPVQYFGGTRSILLSAAVSAFVTLVLTVRSVGLAPHLAETWLTTLKLSLLIGLPARFLLEPYVARLVGLFVEQPRTE